MRQNSKKINNLISKVLKETLEERADDITSKLKSDINELGGMTPDSQDEEHPFYRVNFATMSREDIEDLLKKHYGRGLEDEEEEEEEDFEDMKGEMEEGFDSEEMSMFRKRKDFDPNEFEEIPLGKGKVGFPDESEMDDYTGSHPGRFVMNQIKRRLRDLEGEDEGEFTEGKGDMCEQCGSSSVNEGECKECGYKMEGIYDVYDLDDDNEFDYVQKEEDMEMEDGSNMESELEKRIERFCHSEEKDKSHCEDLMKMKKDMKGGEMTEKLHGNQDRLDHNKNGRIDSEDLRMAREKGKKRETDEEVEEGNLFSGKRADAIEKGEKEFEVDGKTYPVKESVKKCKVCGMKNCKCNHKKNTKENRKGKKSVKESVRLSEEQMIDLIEKVVIEQKEKLKSVGKPRGLQKYQQAHEKSGKENKDYLKSVDKKMKDYLKDGSKGDYSMEPKMFPKTNGQLAKMKAKKYTMSDDGKEFLDDYMRPAMESLVPDEIQYDENWVSDSIQGSSRTGNNPEWANAEKTDLGKKINKKRKDQKYYKAKMAAYRKSKQPVTDGTGEMAGSGVNIKLESTNPKQEKVLNEEFDRMKNLIGYNRKTQ